MTFFPLTDLAGVLTIASPCIVPILPFILGRADEPFRRGSRRAWPRTWCVRTRTRLTNSEQPDRV